MYKTCIIFSLCLFGFFFPAKAQSQSTEASDTIYYQNALASVVMWYNQAVGVNSPLYKGKEYLDYNFRIEGNQYFQSDLWQKGSVFYEGQFYQDVTMKYDIANKVVILDHAQLPVPITLESSSVEHFSLLGHHFIRLVADTTNAAVSTGFYDLLYDGNTQFLINREKVLRDEIDDRKLRFWFEEKDTYFIRKEGAYYKVKSKKSVLNVFPNHKKEIRKFLKKNKIKYRKQREEAIYLMVKYYDQEAR